MYYFFSFFIFSGRAEIRFNLCLLFLYDEKGDTGEKPAITVEAVASSSCFSSFSKCAILSLRAFCDKYFVLYSLQEQFKQRILSNDASTLIE